MELGSQDAPEIDLDAILDGFWMDFGADLGGFSKDFRFNLVPKRSQDEER